MYLLSDFCKLCALSLPERAFQMKQLVVWLEHLSENYQGYILLNSNWGKNNLYCDDTLLLPTSPFKKFFCVASIKKGQERTRRLNISLSAHNEQHAFRMISKRNILKFTTLEHKTWPFTLKTTINVNLIYHTCIIFGTEKYKHVVGLSINEHEYKCLYKYTMKIQITSND